LKLETRRKIGGKIKRKNKKKIRVLNNESRNQAQEIRVVMVAEAEQA